MTKATYTSRFPWTWFVAAIALSTGVSYFVASRTVPGRGERHHPPSAADGHSFHAWTHDRLELTPKQESRLAPIEAAYEKERRALLARIETAGEELAHAIATRDGAPDAFRPALDELQTSQNALQRLTLEHFFEMKDHLSPSQAERLREWIHDSLAHEHRH